MGSLSAQSIYKELSPSGDKSVRLLISDSNWLEQTAIDQLQAVARLPGMCRVIGMPDLHPGKGQPIGAAFIARDVVYPHLVGSDIGCGMGLWHLDIKRRKVRLDKWQKRLSQLSDENEGAKPLNIESTPLQYESVFEGFTDKLGTIGGGNHFAEIQCVESVFDELIFSQAGLDKEAVVMLVHSGSRGLGQKILSDHLSVFGASGLSGCDLDHYLAKHDYADQWAKCNRELIATRFLGSLGVSGHQVLDVSHNHVRRLDPGRYLLEDEKYSERGNYWIHRKGASPVDNGLVMIPGSRGSLSYLVQPRYQDEAAVAQGGFSLAHGAGRKWKRSDCKGRLQAKFKAKDLETTALGSRVICKQRSLLYEEAPQAYKDIDVVISDLVTAGMIDVVARFKPMITYKTTRK